MHLDNNIIEEISGLDHLVNLEWLDLSFNNIKKIQGLEHLVNLTDLSLFQNHISKLEGMDNLLKLNYFSIGNNEIGSTDEMPYLQKFKNLQVLIIQGNPFTKNDSDNDTRNLVIATLPQLKYLDYMMIDADTLKHVETNNITTLNSAKEALQMKPEVSVESKIKELEEANIAGTYEFLEKLKDQDMKKLELVPKQNELWAKFEEELKESLSTYQDNMKSTARKRKQAMEICENLLKEEEKATEDKGIVCINTFKQKKKHVFRDIQNQKQNIISVDEVKKELQGFSSIDELRKELKQLDSDLMRIEMDHFDLAWNQVESKFNTNISRITGDMSKDTQDFKDTIVKNNKKYHDTLREIFAAQYDDIANRVNEMISENDPNHDEIINTFGERETLMGIAEASNTTQTGRIEEACNAIQGLLANVQSAFRKKMLDQIISRNRRVVKEILSLLKQEEEDIDKFVKENTALEDEDN